MSSLIDVSQIQPQQLSLGILIHIYVRKCLQNELGHSRRQTVTNGKTANNEKPTLSSNHTNVATPAKSTIGVYESPIGGGGGAGGSPAVADSSFFSSTSSIEPTTPQPVAFNLGLNLGASTPNHANAQSSNSDSDFTPFPKKCFQKLGLLLQKAIQNGCTFDSALYTASTPTTLTASSSLSDLSTFPTAPPRYPTLYELCHLIRTQLPQQDQFHIVVEHQLRKELQLLQRPDDIFSLIHSLSNLLIVYSHKIPQTAQEEIRALDESCPLGLFIRSLKLQLDGGLFDFLSRAFERLENYKRAGGIEVEPILMNDEFESPIKLAQTATATPISANKAGVSTSTPTLANPFSQPASFDLDSHSLHPKSRLSDRMDDVIEEMKQSLDGDWNQIESEPWKFELVEGELEEEARQYQRQMSNAVPESVMDAMPPPATIAPFLHQCALRLPLLASRLDPQSLEKLITSLRGSSGSQLPLFYYLCYLKHVAAREFPEALDYCYRYFDYFSGQAAAASEGANDAEPKRHRTLTQQYASLALAQLHYSFEHYSTAVTSIQETIKIAQQNKDEQALRFAMELLHKIIEAKSSVVGSGENSNLLHRCLITQYNASLRSKKPSVNSTPLLASSSSAPLPQLDASNSLMMAKFLCVRMVTNRSRTNLTSNQPQEVWKAFERAIALAVTSHSSAILASAYVLRSTGWSLFGSNFLAHLATNFHLQQHDKANSLDTIHALVQLVLNPSASPTYDSQVRLIQFIKERYPYPVESGVQELVLHAEFDIELSNNDLKRAEEVAKQIYTLGPSKTIHFQNYVSAVFVELRLAYYSHTTPVAALFLQLLSLIQDCLHRCERILVARLLGFLTRILSDSLAEGHEGVICLTSVLDAYSLARGLHMKMVEIEILLYIAAIHLTYGGYQECERILRTCFKHIAKQSMRSGPLLSSTGSSTAHSLPPSTASPPSIRTFQYRLELLHARCVMGRISASNSVTADSSPPVSDSTNRWHDVIRHLQLSLTYAQTPSEKKQLYYLLSRAYHELGVISERNSYAEQFCRLDTQPGL